MSLKNNMTHIVDIFMIDFLVIKKEWCINLVRENTSIVNKSDN